MIRDRLLNRLVGALFTLLHKRPLITARRW